MKVTLSGFNVSFDRGERSNFTRMFIQENKIKQINGRQLKKSEHPPGRRFHSINKMRT